MNVLNTSKLGELGEQMACDFLQTRGHQILDRNWRGGHLEIDIASEAADGLHFVEVKAPKAPVTTSIDDQVNSVKRKRISAAALKYSNNKNLAGREVFFDIVSVLFNGQETTVRYIPQAWIPLYTY